MGIDITASCDTCGSSDVEDECYCSKCSVKRDEDAGHDLVGDLAAAIRRGDRGEAEYLLDRIADELPGWRDRIEIGRYSPAARRAA